MEKTMLEKMKRKEGLAGLVDPLELWGFKI